MRYVLNTLAVSVALLGLSACNTIQGLGEDLEAGGRAVARSAAEVQADIQQREQAAPTAQQPTAPLTSLQARARALSVQPGAIESEETIADAQGGTHYVFRIRGEDGAVYAVDIDAGSGAATQARL